MDDVNEKQSIEVDTDTLVKNFQDICESVEAGAGLIEKFFESKEVKAVSEYAKVLAEPAADCLKIYGAIKKAASIPSKLYLSKLDRFLRGLTSIPLDKRQRYIRLVSKEQYNKDSVYILEMINRIEDVEKVDILLRLFELRMTELITDNEFRRMSLMVASTMKVDLDYMAQNISSDSFEIKRVEEEGLLLAGWLIYDGISMGDAEKESGNLYRYTALAIKFCKDVWNAESVATSRNDVVKFKPIDNGQFHVENTTVVIDH